MKRNLGILVAAVVLSACGGGGESGTTATAVSASPVASPGAAAAPGTSSDTAPTGSASAGSAPAAGSPAATTAGSSTPTSGAAASPPATPAPTSPPANPEYQLTKALINGLKLSYTECRSRDQYQCLSYNIAHTYSPSTGQTFMLHPYMGGYVQASRNFGWQVINGALAFHGYSVDRENYCTANGLTYGIPTTARVGDTGTAYACDFVFGKNFLRRELVPWSVLPSGKPGRALACIYEMCYSMDESGNVDPVVQWAPGNNGPPYYGASWPVREAIYKLYTQSCGAQTAPLDGLFTTSPSAWGSCGLPFKNTQYWHNTVLQWSLVWSSDVGSRNVELKALYGLNGVECKLTNPTVPETLSVYGRVDLPCQSGLVSNPRYWTTQVRPSERLGYASVCVSLSDNASGEVCVRTDLAGNLEPTSVSANSSHTSR